MLVIVGVEVSDSGVEMKEVEIVRNENDEDEVYDEEYLDEGEDEDEDDYVELDMGVGSDDEGMNYFIIGDLEDFDELGELVSGVVVVELFFGSGEIEFGNYFFWFVGCCIGL